MVNADRDGTGDEIMNRRIRKELSNIRTCLKNIDTILDNEEQLPDEGKELAQELTPSTEMNWTAGDEEPKGLNLSQIKELSSLKDITIEGTIKTVFDLKSYINKKTNEAGMIYRFVLEDESDDLTAITFDKMATEFKQYMIGTRLRITNAWKIQENKHQVKELHVGNFAKVEVVE